MRRVPVAWRGCFEGGQQRKGCHWEALVTRLPWLALPGADMLGIHPGSIAPQCLKSCRAACHAGLLRDLGVPLNPSQLSQAIAQLDTSQTGKITFGEFLLWWKG